MAADKQAIILSRVHACCSIIVTCHYAKCNPSLRDICLLTILFLDIINTTSMHKINISFITYIDGPLGE